MLKQQILTKTVVPLLSMQLCASLYSGSSMTQVRYLEAGKCSWNWRLGLSGISPLNVGWIWPVTNVQSSYTLLDRKMHQSCLAENWKAVLKEWRTTTIQLCATGCTCSQMNAEIHS